MNLAHLDLGTNSYSLTVSNEDVEDKMIEERQMDDNYSTASNFTVILNPTIDLTHLLFLKSVQAEMAVESISINSCPLTVSRLEYVEIYLTTPPSSSLINLTYNEESVREKNRIPLRIPLRDISTDNEQELIDQLNKLVFQEVVTNFIISKYCQLTFDLDVFKEHQLTRFSKGEANLLHRYLNVTFYSRAVIHQTLKECLDKSLPEDHPLRREPLFNEDIEKLWKYKDATAEIRTRAGETKVLKNSKNLKSLEEREATEYKTINFDKFYKVNCDIVEPTLRNFLKTSMLDQWTDTGFLVRDEASGRLSIPTEKMPAMIQKFVSNRNLLEYAQLIKNLLELQNSLHDKRRTPDMLFENQIISMRLDDTKAKCYFHIAKQHFLASDGTTCQIILPKFLSYNLGARPQKFLSLGPLSLYSPEESFPRLSEEIVSSNQRLFSTMRPQPKLINVTTNVITTKTRDLKLRKSDFADHQLIFTFDLLEEQISRRFIFKQNENPIFHPISNIHNILDAFSICLIDENYQAVQFAPRTICNLSLKFRPVAFESL